MFDPLPTIMGTLYNYTPLLVSTWGPGVPEVDELESFGSVVSFHRIIYSSYGLNISF